MYFCKRVIEGYKAHTRQNADNQAKVHQKITYYSRCDSVPGSTYANIHINCSLDANTYDTGILMATSYHHFIGKLS